MLYVGLYRPTIVFVSERVLKSQKINHSETLKKFSMFFDMSFQENVKNEF